MGYNVYVRETYKGGPAAREQTNFEISANFESLDEALDFMSRDIWFMKSLQRRVIKETTEMQEGLVVRKYLMERVGRHGRVLRVYRVTNLHKQVIHDDFELI